MRLKQVARLASQAHRAKVIRPPKHKSRRAETSSATIKIKTPVVPKDPLTEAPKAGTTQKQPGKAVVPPPVKESEVPKGKTPKSSKQKKRKAPAGKEPAPHLARKHQGQPSQKSLPHEHTKKEQEKLPKWLRPRHVEISRVDPLHAAEVPTLAHGLDRVLFNPNVYWLQDPHSRVYNFEPYLQKLIPPDDFAYDRLPKFMPAAQDPDMWELAKKHDKKYMGSTSGLTGIMSHVYWLISRWRPLDTRSLSADFAREPNTYGFGCRSPVSTKLVYQDGRYAVDPDKDWEVAGKASNILSYLGVLMEKMLTMDPETFSRLTKAVPEQTPGEFHKREAYHYSKTAKLLMRSQLDCHDPRLPGSGTFDLKTRGVIPIRRDRLNYVENSGYLIRYSQGLFESFEREYYDMMRSAFLKYNFQVRIGDMDGIFVAYHNTAQIFGFQYITKEEMDIRLFGSSEMADDAFHLILGMVEAVFDKATSLFPDQTLKLTFETPEGQHTMHVWVQPEEWDEEKAGERPIFRLNVQTQNFLDGQLVAHPVDYDSVRKGDNAVDWAIKYRISQSPATAQGRLEARTTLEKARSRQQALLSLYLPSGVGEQEMLAKFDTMDIADIIRARQTPAEAESEHEGFVDDAQDSIEEDVLPEPTKDEPQEVHVEDVDSSGALKQKGLKFMRPGGFIKQLRRLAKAGAADSQRMKELESNKEPVVWRPSSNEK